MVKWMLERCLARVDESQRHVGALRRSLLALERHGAPGSYGPGWAEDADYALRRLGRLRRDMEEVEAHGSWVPEYDGPDRHGDR